MAKVAAVKTVSIGDNFYSPRTISIKVGDTVTWRNDGAAPHSATADGGSFDTGVFNGGQSRSETFSTAGTVPYFCTVHGQAQSGTIEVRSSGGGGRRLGRLLIRDQRGRRRRLIGRRRLQHEPAGHRLRGDRPRCRRDGAAGQRYGAAAPALARYFFFFFFFLHFAAEDAFFFAFFFFLHFLAGGGGVAATGMRRR